MMELAAAAEHHVAPACSYCCHPVDVAGAGDAPMDQALRKTGIPLMDEIPWGSHLALFYETERDLLDSCAAYFAAGLRHNEACVWAVVDTVAVEAARQALQDAIPDFDRYEADGAVELLPGREFYLRDGVFDMQRLIDNRHDRVCRARERGFDGLRVSGNAWLAASERGEYFSFRRELARTVGDDPVLVLGTYELGASRAVDVLDVARVHHLTVVRRRGEWQFMETPESKQANALTRQIDDVSDISDASDIIARPFPGRELLTERERVVLAKIVNGASSKEIARDLSVSPRTVDFHRANILDKLGARNTAELVRLVLSRG
jgi:DNA-binding CsgD family transcriptional regulator